MADMALLTAVVLSCAAAYIGRSLARARERNRGVRVLFESLKSALWSIAMHLPHIYPIAVIAVAVAVASMALPQLPTNNNNGHASFPCAAPSSLLHLVCAAACNLAAFYNARRTAPLLAHAFSHDVLRLRFPPHPPLHPERDCARCSGSQPSRSRHCTDCNGCVLLADHHCFWTGRCVGLGSLGPFLCWLFTLSASSFVASMVCIYALQAMVERRGLWAARVLLPGGLTASMTLPRLLAHLAHVQPALLLAAVLLLLLTAAVGLLLARHLKLAGRNTTLYELAKARRMGLTLSMVGYDTGSAWQNWKNLLSTGSLKAGSAPT